MQQVLAVAVSAGVEEHSFTRVPEKGEIRVLDVKKVFDARARHGELMALERTKGLSPEERKEASRLKDVVEIPPSLVKQFLGYHAADRKLVRSQVEKTHQTGMQVYFHIRFECPRGRIECEQFILPDWCFAEEPFQVN